MAALTVSALSYAGTAPTFDEASGGGDTAKVNSGRNFLVVRNGGGSSVTVTVTVPDSAPYAEAQHATVTYSVAANGEVWVPLHPNFADSSGNAAVAYSSATSVTAAVVTPKVNA